MYNCTAFDHSTVLLFISHGDVIVCYLISQCNTSNYIIYHCSIILSHALSHRHFRKKKLKPSSYDKKYWQDKRWKSIILQNIKRNKTSAKKIFHRNLNVPYLMKNVPSWALLSISSWPFPLNFLSISSLYNSLSSDLSEKAPVGRK